MAESITLARPYAKAAFEVAVADGDLANWSKMLGTLAALSRHEKISTLLKNPSLTAERQSAALVDLAGDEVSAKCQNMIRLLAENRRLALLPEIAVIFDALKANHEKTVEVDLSTAFELSSGVVDQLTQALQKRLDRKINIHATVDSRLIGGVVIKAGDMVIDSSVRGKLNKLAESMNS